MQDWLSARAQNKGRSLALIIQEKQWTYAELNRAVTEYAALLHSLGVQRGQHIGILMPNSFQYVCTIHALMRLGAVMVPLNVRLTDDELLYQLDHSGCQLVLSAGISEERADALSVDGRSVIAIGDAGTEQADDHSLRAFEQGRIDLAADFAIVYTSGTSGKPKGVVLTFASIFHSANASAYRIGTMPDDRWLCVMPLYHVGGLSIIVRAALYGIAVDLHARFDVDVVNYALSSKAITLVSMVPTMLQRLIEAPGRPAWSPKLRMILLGGAAASDHLLEQCMKLDIPVATTYGLSEAASQVATALPDDVRRKPGSVGKPLMFNTVRIVDEAGQDRLPGEYGEILVSGPTIMRAYHEDDAASARALSGAYLHTGDIGYLDEDGDLWLVQRRSDLIVSGGENVYPAEVEGVIRQHPAVREVAVVGLPSIEWGQQVAAAVVLHDDFEISAEALLEFCRRKLAGYKQPRVLRFVSELPMTASGKVLRADVLELLQ